MRSKRLSRTESLSNEFFKEKLELIQNGVEIETKSAKRTSNPDRGVRDPVP